MYKPDPQDPKFGSEVLRLETPEHRRKRRRRDFRAGLFGLAMGAASLYVGIDAVQTGEPITGPSGFMDLSGEEMCVLAAAILLMSAWALWRHFESRER